MRITTASPCPTLTKMIFAGGGAGRAVPPVPDPLRVRAATRTARARTLRIPAHCSTASARRQLRLGGLGLAGVRRPREVGRPSRVLADGPVDIRLLDRRLRFREIVARLDEEQRRVFANTRVFLRPDRELVGAAARAAFADDSHRVGRRREPRGEAANLLVDTSEDRLVLADAALALVHARSSARGSSSAVTSPASPIFSTTV